MSAHTIIGYGDGVTSDVGVWDNPLKVSVGGGSYNEKSWISIQDIWLDI